MYLKVTTLAEFLLTNVTYEPSTFIVWLQQMCLELEYYVKQSEQCLHEYGFAPVWVLLTYMTLQIKDTFKPLPTVATLPCTWRLCLCKWLDWLKLLSHSEHLYGLSSVWTLMCLVRPSNGLNALSHWGHLCGFSPLWILLCLARLAESFATNSTFKRFLSRMTSSVYC